jgi:O-antigen ligase
MLDVALFSSLTIILFGLLWYTCFLLGSFKWLERMGLAIIISLPFERIPSIDIGGANLRISQILVVVSFILFSALVVKKDVVLIESKKYSILLLTLVFLIASSTSWFNIVDKNRFFITTLATILCFGGAFIISITTNSHNIIKRLTTLSYTIFGTCIFGVYQFIGDMAGIPNTLTGLREQYTKVVFGIPRIHATAIEPLYFAGILYFPIIFGIVQILSRQKSHSNTPQQYLYLGFLLLIFLLTISKSAIVILLGCIIAILLFVSSHFEIKKVVSTLGIFLSTLVGIIFGIYSLYLPSRPTIDDIIGNAISTFGFESGSSAERIDFIQRALDLLPKNIISGIGSGQFGVIAKNVFSSTDGGYLIVNNVYLEVWLEMGILAFFVFIYFLLRPLFINIHKLLTEKNWHTQLNIARISLVGTLISYYIQWFSFSPIFIMPIFILIGLLSGLEQETSTTNNII